MKVHAFAYLFTLFLVIILSALVAWLTTPLLTHADLVVSPLPSFLTRITNNQVTGIDIWLPNIHSDDKNLDLTASAALSYDLTTNKILFAKNPNKPLPMASLTKIMTATVALEHPQTGDAYVVHQQDLVGEDSMGLSVGESLSLSDLLYGLVLHSGNDAAETIADNFPGGREAFIDAMNKKAKSLGLKNTHFTNPTGLQGDGNQYTTAKDLLVMTEYALSHFPLFDTVVSTFDYTIPQSPLHKEYALENETNLVSSYPGVKGVKDGYTPQAGLCLVTYLDYDGHQIIAVILGSDDRRGEMKDLLDYSLKKLNIVPPVHN